MSSTLPAIAARPCRADEHAAVLAAVRRVFLPGGGGDIVAGLPLLLGPANLENLRVIVEHGRIVAHAGVCFRTAVVHGRRLEVALLGCVYTEPGARGRGLATCAVAGAIAHARSRGAGAVIASGAGPLYRRLGFVDAPAMTRWRVAPGTEPSASGRLRLDPATPGALDVLRALHDAEPVRFERGLDHWRSFLETRWLVSGPGDLWLASPVGAPRPAVSLGIQRGRVLEYTGDRAAVVAAAASLAASSGAAITIWQRPGDEALATAASAAGAAAETFAFPASCLWLAGPVHPLPWYGLDYV